MQGFPKLEKPSFLRGTILEVEARDNILAGERVAIMPTGGTVQLYYTSSIATSSPSSSYSQTYISCSADGSIVAVVRSSAPYVYRWDGTGFTAISLSSNPSGTVYSVAVSPDGRYLAIATASSPYLFCYEYVGGTFVARSLSASPGAVGGVKFNSENVLAFGARSSSYGPYLYLPGETFTQVVPDQIMGRYHHSLVWISTDTIYFFYAESSTYSQTLYYYTFRNNQFQREGSYSSSCGNIACYNPQLGYILYKHINPGSLYCGIPPSSYPTFYTPSFDFYAAVPTPTGFIVAANASQVGIFEYVEIQYNKWGLSLIPTSITSFCDRLACTSDGKTIFAGIGGYLSVLKYVPAGVQYAYKSFNLPASLYYCIALENIPKGSVGKVILQQ